MGWVYELRLALKHPNNIRGQRQRGACTDGLNFQKTIAGVCQIVWSSPDSRSILSAAKQTPAYPRRASEGITPPMGAEHRHLLLLVSCEVAQEWHPPPEWFIGTSHVTQEECSAAPKRLSGCFAWLTTLTDKKGHCHSRCPRPGSDTTVRYGDQMTHTNIDV